MQAYVRIVVAILLCLFASVPAARSDDLTDSEIPNEHSTRSGEQPKNPFIVPGRCHSHGCWWWRILAVEKVEERPSAILLKVGYSMTEAEYSPKEIDAHGYPEAPPRFAEWDPPEELFVFCSTTLPAVIEREASGRSYSATVPFRRDGSPAGTHDDLANLYRRVCVDPSGVFEMPARLEGRRATLSHPREIFSGIPE